MARLADEVPEIAELDLNPVMAFPPGAGVSALDARVLVRPPAASSQGEHSTTPSESDGP